MSDSDNSGPGGGGTSKSPQEENTQSTGLGMCDYYDIVNFILLVFNFRSTLIILERNTFDLNNKFVLCFLRCVCLNKGSAINLRNHLR